MCRFKYSKRKYSAFFNSSKSYLFLYLSVMMYSDLVVKMLTPRMTQKDMTFTFARIIAFLVNLTDIFLQGCGLPLL